MATPSSFPFPITGDPIIDATIHGYYWDVGQSKTINWSISDNLNEDLIWYNPTAAGGIAEQIDAIFDIISTYVDIDFNYVGYWNDPTTAASMNSDINISLSISENLFSSSNVLASAFFPDASGDSTHYKGISGDIFINLNSEANYYESFSAGSQGWFLLLHEIGHALGLKHPHDDGGTGRPTLEQIGLSELDYDWASVMSYNDDYSYNTLAFDPATPMLLDIIGLQYLYGKNSNNNSGDGLYTLSKTNTYATIWDASGSDIVDASSNTEAWHIHLSTEDLTSIGFATSSSEITLPSPKNFFWLMGDFEHAIGSIYDDTIVGNNLDNMLYGNWGSDFIDGGAGVDTASFSGSMRDYSMTRGQTSDTISGHQGTDVLLNIERLEFSDGNVAIDIDGNAGAIASILAAVFGGETILNTEYVGIGLDLIDNGRSIEQICELALQVAGANTHDDVVELLYSNLFGATPSESEKAPYVALLDNGEHSKASLTVAAADLVDDFGVVDFIGLSRPAIESFLTSTIRGEENKIGIAIGPPSK